MSSLLRKRLFDAASSAKEEAARSRKVSKLDPKPALDPQSTDDLQTDPLANGDTASIIFSFLNCRDLLSMASTSKLLMERVTYEHVMQSALMNGGHAAASVDRMMALVRERRVYIPSPMRLLRVANGQRCECCLRDRVNLLSADYGVFLGRKCCLREKTWSRCVPNDDFWGPILSEPRMARRDTSSYTHIFDQPFRKSGQLHGPILTARCWIELCDEREGAVVELLQRRDKLDPNASRFDEILHAYGLIRADAKVRKEQREEEYIRKQDASWNKFVERSELVVQRLKAELGQRPDGESLLTWTPPHRGKDKKRFPGEFTNPLLNELMTEILKAPSSFKGAAVTRAVGKCQQILQAASSLMQLDFLSETDPYESALMEYCRSRKEKGLRRRILLNMDKFMLHAIQNGKRIKALELLISVEAPAIETLARTMPQSDNTSNCDALKIGEFARQTWNSMALQLTSTCRRHRYQMFVRQGSPK